MTYGFRRTRKGVRAELGDAERHLLLSLLRQTADLLEDATGGPATTPGPAADDDSFEAIMLRAGFGADDGDATSEEPSDPAVRRLLPDAHHDDPELAAEFRRLVGRSVRDRKLDHLRRAVACVERCEDGRMRPDEAEAVSLLIAMTDVRLVLADRLGLHDDEAAESLSDRVAELEEDDPAFSLALGYEFLTWLQETLAVALHP